MHLITAFLKLPMHLPLSTFSTDKKITSKLEITNSLSGNCLIALLMEHIVNLTTFQNCSTWHKNCFIWFRSFLTVLGWASFAWVDVEIEGRSSLQIFTLLLRSPFSSDHLGGHEGKVRQTPNWLSEQVGPKILKLYLNLKKHFFKVVFL